METHAILSPSGAHRWLHCPGSASLTADMPNESSEFAAEGTAAHELATVCFEAQKPAVDFLGKLYHVEGFTFEVDHEMVDAVQQYLDFCHNLEGQFDWTEKKVFYTDWVKDGYGLADRINVQALYAPGADEAHHVINVVDLKYGKGVKVFAEWNEQAMLYALGVLQTLSYLFHFQNRDIVNCVIVQPRLDHIDEFKISVGDLRRWANITVMPQALEALSDNPTFHPGEKQCRFCLAKPTCRALATASLKTASEEFSVIGKDFTLRNTKKLSNAEIGILLEKIPTLVQWAKSVEGYAFDELNAGKVIPGYKLVIGKAKNKSFIEQDDEQLVYSLKLCDLTKKEIITEKIKTPTQLAKIIKTKKGDFEKFDLLWEQNPGEPTIAKDSDKRQAIKSQIENDFEAINSENKEN